MSEEEKKEESNEEIDEEVQEFEELMTVSHWYGKPGTTEMILLPDSLASTNPDYVKMMVIDPPADGKMYVISPTGDWEYPMDNELIKAERQRRYLQKWPVHRQLEAQADRLNGDATLWNEMNIDFKKIKENLPYVNHAAVPTEPQKKTAFILNSKRKKKA